MCQTTVQIIRTVTQRQIWIQPVFISHQMFSDISLMAGLTDLSLIYNKMETLDTNTGSQLNFDGKQNFANYDITYCPSRLKLTRNPVFGSLIF